MKTKKLANAAVDGSKVKDETLDDSKISDYELLGDSFVRVPATDGASFAAARSAAPENPLFSEGPFEIYAKCLRAGNVTQGEIYARTSIDRSLMEGTDDLGGGPAASDFLNTDTPEANRQLDTETSGPAGNNGSIGDAGGALIAPDGTSFTMIFATAARNGTSAGDGPYGPGNACVFQGAVTG